MMITTRDKALVDEDDSRSNKNKESDEKGLKLPSRPANKLQ